MQSSMRMRKGRGEHTRIFYPYVFICLLQQK